ncbi:acetoacetate decarboxylase family protein [Kitasatospora sp. NPDC001660]
MDHERFQHPDRAGVPGSAQAAAGYPPEPWRLRGTMWVSLWPVPERDLPPWRLPPGVRPVVVAGRRLLALFWVDYRPGGVLAYRELLLALAVRDGPRIAFTVVSAWVDSEQAVAGGRALWGIPKELGEFGLDRLGRETRLRMTGEGAGPVRAAHRHLVALPGRLSVRARLVQCRPGGLSRVPLRLTGEMSLGRVRLVAAADGALPFLNGRRPLTALAVSDFRAMVGGDSSSAEGGTA